MQSPMQLFKVYSFVIEKTVNFLLNYAVKCNLATTFFKKNEKAAMQ